MLARFIPDNPVLTKELRVRMRGGRAYLILFTYLGFLTVLMLYQYYDWQNNVNRTGVGASDIASLGTDMFQYVLIAQMFLVLFITPAITSGAITIEREQQTLDMLTTTMIPFRSIIVGKLLSAVAFTSLLIISSVPLVSICFMLGGVDPAMVFGAYVSMLLGSLLVGAMGLAWSSAHKSTTPAVLSTYGTLFVIVMFIWGVGGLALGPGAGAFATPFQAMWEVWFGNRFLGVGGIDGLGFDVLCLLGAWLLGALAMVRLEINPDRRAGLLRGLTCLVVGSQLFLFSLWWLHAWYSRGTGKVLAVVGPPIGALCLIISAFIILVPVFSTGNADGKPDRHFLLHFVRSMSPTALSRGGTATGIGYLLWSVLIYLACHCLAFVAAGHFAAAFTSPHDVSSTVTAPQAAGITGILAASAPVKYVVNRTDLPHAAIVMLAFVFGFGAFCQLVSMITRSRRVALWMSYLAIGLIVIVPDIERSMARTPIDAGFFVNLFYLNPIQSVVQLEDPASYFADRFLLLGNVAMWIVTSVSWLIIGLFSLVIASFISNRQAAKTPSSVTIGAVAGY